MKKILCFLIVAVITLGIISCSDDSGNVDFNNGSRISKNNTVSAQAFKTDTAKSLNLDGKIGEVNSGGQFVITISIAPLKKHWETYLREELSINTSLSGFEILEVNDEAEPTYKGYILTAFAANLGSQVAVLIDYNAPSNSFRLYRASLNSAAATTYSCSGCNACRLSVERFPSGRLKQVNCRPGCVAPRVCTKTETVTIID